MRLTRIYTRSGDGGTTRLAHGEEVPKDHPRVVAYGVVDELNAAIGVARATGLGPKVDAALAPIQNRLFDLGADLATPRSAEVEFPVPRLESGDVKALEELIDETNAVVGPLENFVLPGGSPGAAWLHVARTVCRRAERQVVTLAREEEIGEHALAWLNRLSDALFVLARLENHERQVPEPLWEPDA